MQGNKQSPNILEKFRNNQKKFFWIIKCKNLLYKSAQCNGLAQNWIDENSQFLVGQYLAGSSERLEMTKSTQV